MLLSVNYCHLISKRVYQSGPPTIYSLFTWICTYLYISTHDIWNPNGSRGQILARRDQGYAGGLLQIMLGLRPKEQSMQIAWIAAAAAFVLELPGQGCYGSYVDHLGWRGTGYRVEKEQTLPAGDSWVHVGGQRL